MFEKEPLTTLQEKVSDNDHDAGLETLPSSDRQQDLDSTSTHSEHVLRGFPLIIVIFSLCLSQFLSALDITIVATALPTITRQLGSTNAQYTWVGTSYNLASTASTPLWGKFSDIWGRKPLILLANALFMAGSLIAGLSRTPDMLLAGRALQGFGGGGITILITVIIADLFPLSERGKYYGMSAIVWAIASALGPVLGGVFTQTIGWRWCCKSSNHKVPSKLTLLVFINLPLDLISLVLLCFVLRIKNPKTGFREGLRTLDWIGCIVIVTGTICLLCGLEGGASGQHGWSSPYTLALLIVGIAMLISYVFWEARFAACPITPVRVFAGRFCAASMVAGTFHGFIFIAYDYYLPLYYQVILGATPIVSGVYLFALVIPLSLISASTGIFIKRTGNYHHALWFGSVFMTIGTGLFINFGTNYALWKIIVFQAIAGIGAGPLFIAPLLALQNHLRKADISTGSSALTFLRSMASSISIVVGGVILQSGLPGISLTGSTLHSDRSGGGISSDTAQLYVSALGNMWIFYTALGGVVIFASFMITSKTADRKFEDEEG